MFNLLVTSVHKVKGCLTNTWWFVLRLSICFLKTLVQKSLQMNFMMSSSSLKRAVSLVNLKWKSFDTYDYMHDI